MIRIADPSGVVHTVPVPGPRATHGVFVRLGGAWYLDRLTDDPRDALSRAAYLFPGLTATVAL